MKLMIPEVFDGIASNINEFVDACKESFSFIEFFDMIGKIFITFFKGATNWLWWLYFIICFSIALNMNLSKADLKGTVKAIPFIIIIFVAINFILYYLSLQVCNSTLNLYATSTCQMIFTEKRFCICTRPIYTHIYKKKKGVQRKLYKNV